MVVMVFLASFCNAICPEFQVKEMAEKEFQSESSHVQIWGQESSVFHPVTSRYPVKNSTRSTFFPTNVIADR
jgi:hypothetical protein